MMIHNVIGLDVEQTPTNWCNYALIGKCWFGKAQEYGSWRIL